MRLLTKKEGSVLWLKDSNELAKTNLLKEAQKVFNEADKILKEPLSDLIFNGPDNELIKTNNAQPAILISSIAMLEVIKSKKKIKLSNFCKFLAGHSLGEYTALYASNVLDFESVLKLVKHRGNLMSKSDKSGEGKMAAIIGLKIVEIKEMLQNFKEEGVCEIANDNSEGQVVISGNKEAVDSFKSIEKKKGAKLTIDLNQTSPVRAAKNNNLHLETYIQSRYRNDVAKIGPSRRI